MAIPKDLESKLNGIISFLKDKKVIVAFSGGVDSSLLSFLSKKFAREAFLVTERSVLYPEEEIEETKEFAKKYDIPHVIIERNPLDDEQFKCNPKNRCYICKTGLYDNILKIKEEKRFDVVLDGSNYDDLSDYRPGMNALKDLEITTLYIDYEMTKQEIRELCKHFDLEVQSKPSMACFSSRIPYEQIICKEKIVRIREGEKFLKQTFNLKQLRVRHHNNNLARIELLPEDMSQVFSDDNLKLIITKFKELGFVYVTIDLEGFRSGSMNETLDINP